MKNLAALLSENPYPGRGVLCARTLSGEVVGGYFLTGRSPASRDRAVRIDGDELVVAPATVTEHDPLRHYVAAEATEDWLVFGNGEQVSTVTGRLRRGVCAAEALDDLEYEPDPPILTSRVTALLSRDGGRTAVLGAARPSSGARTSTNIMTLTVRDLEPGDAVLLTTYQSDGQNVSVAVPFTEASTGAEDAGQLLEEIWNGLNDRYRIAVAVLDPAKGPGNALIRAS
ncbi:IMP cyclohydrolase [Streptomyces phyllanthi]|uniref:Inosine monophosphate cyclohydrolase-like domain-containing protein n=1 Tax=Streptomyces phyllanthi TaxID=1803180 RepID=A0A5N8VUP5_9ACTN|nr:IMP cyclohydrolase [Streptomyces phyllanthi]MPY38970.1 hypothetical protein [Streptomyces phyllanthi]